MQRIRNLNTRLERLSPPEGHYFFGYYDVPAWSSDQQYHLCHKTSFCDRLPGPKDIAVLGLIRVSDREFVPIAETTAWNFQQGSMLQWRPASNDREVVFNRRTGDRFLGVVKNVRTGDERELDLPVAAVSPSGDRAASISFSRMFDFRPGYGYAGTPDPVAAMPRPAEDGLFLLDLSSGRSELIMSLADICRKFPHQGSGHSILINHVSFNPEGTRLLLLVRDNPRVEKARWSTLMLTCDLCGGTVRCLQEWGHVSHYNWRDVDHLACYCSPKGVSGLYVVDDTTSRAELVDGGFFRSDGHCSYSPDRTRLLYDSYPSPEGYRGLYVYDLKRRIGRTLGEFYSLPTENHDIRTDLHPRWSPSGRRISFDSTHDGFRGLYTADAD